jgi:hypothetical protein
MKPLLLVSLTVILACCQQNTPPAPQYRFYDFDITLTVRDPVGGIQERYILANLSNERTQNKDGLRHVGKLSAGTLHLIKYATSSNTKKRLRKIADPRDTTRIGLRKGQMDTIYALTTTLFAAPADQNLASDSVVAPAKEYNGISATVDFNLGNRGNYYKAYIPNASHSFALHTYLKHLVAQHRKKHPPIT